MNHAWPRVQLLLAALLFSTGGVAIKGNALTAWQVASFRSAIAALALLILLPESRRNWSWKLVPPSIAYAGTLLFFVLSAKLTTAAHAIFLQSTAPAYLVFLSPLLLGERIRRNDYFLLAAVAVGMLMLFAGPQQATATASNPSLGNLLGVLSGVAWAFTLVGLRWIGKSNAQANSGMTAIVMGSLIGFLIALPMALPAGPFGTNDIAALLYLGIVQVGLSYLLVTRALRFVPAFEATTLLLLEPVLNPVWTWLMLAEHPGNWAIAGGSVILTATLLKAFWERRQESPELKRLRDRAGA